MQKLFLLSIITILLLGCQSSFKSDTAGEKIIPKNITVNKAISIANKQLNGSVDKAIPFTYQNRSYIAAREILDFYSYNVIILEKVDVTWKTIWKSQNSLTRENDDGVLEFTNVTS